MAQWGTSNVSTNAVSYPIIAGSNATGVDMFVNVTANSFSHAILESVGVFPANVGAVTGVGIAPGWNKVMRGTGPITSVTITTPGTGYANGETVAFGNGVSAGAATINTNGSGVITAVNLTGGGSGFVNAAAVTVTITTVGGTTAVLTPVLGGRANRVQYEPLVVVKGMVGGSTIP